MPEMVLIGRSIKKLKAIKAIDARWRMSCFFALKTLLPRPY